MNGMERSAAVSRRLHEMGLLDRWPELHLEQFENLTGIRCEELGGSIPESHPAYDRAPRDFGGRFFPDEQEGLD